MADKDKVVNLFSEIVRKATEEKKEVKEKPAGVNRIGQVIVTGGSNTINIYNSEKQPE